MAKQMRILRASLGGGIAVAAVAAGVSPAEGHDGLRGRRPLLGLRAQPAFGGPADSSFAILNSTFAIHWNQAAVAELADALDLGSSGRKAVEVRVLSAAVSTGRSSSSAMEVDRNFLFHIEGWRRWALRQDGFRFSPRGAWSSPGYVRARTGGSRRFRGMSGGWPAAAP